MKELWTEKYRPKTIDGYVFTDVAVREQIEEWIEEGACPHLLLHGPAGTGKTTLAKILVNQIGVNPYDFLQVNASKDNGVDFLKDRIESFVSTMPFGDLKVVLLDESDYLSQNAQALMRGLMETYAEQARFILTCNLVHKIIGPLKSRCKDVQINKLDQTEFTTRVAEILINENVVFELEILDSYVKATYPDLRKCINLVQSASIGGSLQAPAESGSAGNTLDYKLTVVDLFKKRKIREARTLLCSQARPEEMEEIFRWMYDNLDLWSSTEEGQDDAILIIKKGMVHHSIVADPEINLSATFTELARIEK